MWRSTTTTTTTTMPWWWWRWWRRSHPEDNVQVCHSLSQAAIASLGDTCFRLTLRSSTTRDGEGGNCFSFLLLLLLRHLVSTVSSCCISGELQACLLGNRSNGMEQQQQQHCTGQDRRHAEARREWRGGLYGVLEKKIDLLHYRKSARMFFSYVYRTGHVSHS